jgi:hypothetical protein
MSRTGFVCLLALCTSLTPAFSATLTTYNSQASFNAALTSGVLIDFNNLVAVTNGQADYSTAAGLTQSGVNFVGVNGSGNYLIATRSDGNANYDWGSSTLLSLPYYWGSAASYLTITLPSNTTAAGFDLMTFSPQAGSFTITMPADLGGGTYVVNTANRPTRSWFGITSDTSISSIQIAVNGVNPVTHVGSIPLLDNFKFGAAAEQPADTPEVATFILIGTGLAAMRYGPRWMKNPIA